MIAYFSLFFPPEKNLYHGIKSLEAPIKNSDFQLLFDFQICFEVFLSLPMFVFAE